MYEHDSDNESFEERIRSIANEISRSVERAAGQVDFDEFADAVGVDPERAREWVQNAGSWLRTQVEQVGEDLAFRAIAHGFPGTSGTGTNAGDDPLRSAAPHPLDMPTAEQGLALAALESGRWTVEPGSHALVGNGEGMGPSDALGLTQELHVRDWISADGHVTLAGRRALRRWLDASAPR
jgi:hypothetical protein